jgi:hypothetical protein
MYTYFCISKAHIIAGFCADQDTFWLLFGVFAEKMMSPRPQTAAVQKEEAAFPLPEPVR